MATGMGGAGIIMNWYSPAGVRIGIDASRRIGGHGDTCHGTGIVGLQGYNDTGANICTMHTQYGVMTEA